MLIIDQNAAPIRRICGNTLRRTKFTPEQLDARATRFLAQAAFRRGAISPICFEFLLDEPTRVNEVVEMSQWLSAPLRTPLFTTGEEV